MCVCTESAQYTPSRLKPMVQAAYPLEDARRAFDDLLVPQNYREVHSASLSLDLHQAEDADRNSPRRRRLRSSYLPQHSDCRHSNAPRGTPSSRHGRTSAIGAAPRSRTHRGRSVRIEVTGLSHRPSSRADEDRRWPARRSGRPRATTPRSRPGVDTGRTRPGMENRLSRARSEKGTSQRPLHSGRVREVDNAHDARQRVDDRADR
jgi:hypothetical protein